METVSFPIGYHPLHKKKIIDYQLNRWYSFGYARLEDMREAADRIRSIEDWKPVMIEQAEKALREKRNTNAAFYYRAAEFFTLPSDKDKLRLYERFIELFDRDVLDDEHAKRILVPYEKAYLPAIHMPSRTVEKKGTIVIHGGFDSFMEEFYSLARHFTGSGYETVLFEGPGQGAALKTHGLPLTHEWEKPAKAVLDHFDLQDVVWLGISMGGWLCFRAAAFEKRIRRVIASSVVFDYLQIPAAPIAAFARLLLRFPKAMNTLAYMKARAGDQVKWGLSNMMYITKKDTPIEAAHEILKLNEEQLHSEKVTQDVLILTGAKDHFIPLKMHHKQAAALTNARSVTERIFTGEDQAQNHCQVGNVGLALEVMTDWMNQNG